jgi:hypothetical protein
MKFKITVMHPEEQGHRQSLNYNFGLKISTSKNLQAGIDNIRNLQFVVAPVKPGNNHLEELVETQDYHQFA